MFMTPGGVAKDLSGLALGKRSRLVDAQVGAIKGVAAGVGELSEGVCQGNTEKIVYGGLVVVGAVTAVRGLRAFPSKPRGGGKGSGGTGSGGTGSGGKGKTSSRISESEKLVREAKQTGKSHQASLDRLTAELSKGNLNPGIGTKPIGKGISEARARDGARVYFRKGADGGVEILGKSHKGNQGAVIKEVLKVYGG
tara:strand:+ start:347 stop:934 length:588 start_codon:yes stop_codon:yes gene_type:complete